jgi:DNA-binding MurR/RpiR family transcriptional regulator
VIRGLEKARQIGLKTLVLTGFVGGKAKALADICLVAPSDSMQHIEDAHLCATHAIFLEIRERIKHCDRNAGTVTAAADRFRSASTKD